MALDEALLRRLIETPGVSGREEQQRVIARELLTELTDGVHTDSLGSVIGTKQGSEDVRIMIAAHTDEIGFLVKYIDDKGFLRLQTLGGHSPANMVSQRVLVVTSDGTTLRGALQPQRKPPHLATAEDEKPPKPDEFYVDLGMSADEVKEKVRVGDYAVMDRTLEKVGQSYIGKAMDDRIGVFVMYEALRAIGEHEATIHAVATSQEEVGLRGATASGSGLEPTVMIALDVTLAMDIPGGGGENEISALGKGAAIKIMDGSLISHPKLVEHFPTDSRARRHTAPDGDPTVRRHRRGRRPAVARRHPGDHALHPLPLRPHRKRDGQLRRRAGLHNLACSLPGRGAHWRLRTVRRPDEPRTATLSSRLWACFPGFFERVRK